MIGATSSHTKTVGYVHTTAPRQQPPPQPKPTKDTSDGIISRPADGASTPPNKPSVTFLIEQTASHSAAKTPIKNQRSEQPRPESPRPESTTRAKDQSHANQHHNGQSQRSAQSQPESTGPESTVSATEASTYATSANDQSHLSQHQNGQSQRSAQPQPAPERLKPTAGSDIPFVQPENARKLSSSTTGTTAGTTNTSSNITWAEKATKSRKLSISLNKSTSAMPNNHKTKNVRPDREILTKKHISYSKRKTIANNKKPLEISLQQIFKTNHELVWFIFHKWYFKTKISLNNARIFKNNRELFWFIFHRWRFKNFKIENFLNTIARIFKTNRELFWFIFHRWRFKHIKIEILVRNRCKTLSFCSDAIFHRWKIKLRCY